MPLEYDPHFPNLTFTGFKPESVPIANTLMLPSCSDSEDQGPHTINPTHDMQLDGFERVEHSDNHAVEFTNPFATRREIILADSYYQGLEDVDPLDHPSYSPDSDFMEWVNFD